MIYEIAQLAVHKERAETFGQAFAKVVPLLSRARGYQGHVLARGIETPDVFNLIVMWRTLEDHTPRFETSQDHEVFMRGIEEYLSDEPRVHHFEGAAFSQSDSLMQTPLHDR